MSYVIFVMDYECFDKLSARTLLRFIYLLMKGDTQGDKMIPHGAEQLALTRGERLLPLEGALPPEDERGGGIEAFGVNFVKDDTDGKVKYVIKLCLHS